MEDAGEQPTVHVVDSAAAAGRSHDPQRLRALFVLVGVIAIAALVLSRIPNDPTSGPPEPIDVVARLEDAINRADPDDVRALLAEDAVLTWPAGPPWGGPLSGSVELVTEVVSTQLLDHVADLDDYLAFYAGIGGETALRRCTVYAQDPEISALVADARVICSFSIRSELLVRLSGDSAVPFGQMRFRIVGNEVAVVLVETWEERFSPIEFLSWIGDERPEAYAEVFSGRVTFPNYSAETAAEIMTLADEYAATLDE
jgi:hypothetical protein